MDEHVMTAQSTNAGEVLFACTVTGCGRRVVVRPGRMVVLERGDFYARHVGAVAPDELQIGFGSVTPATPPLNQN
jgi:hypothetical protein